MTITTTHIEVRNESETAGGITWSVSAMLSDGEREILSAHGSYSDAVRSARKFASLANVIAYAQMDNGGLMMI